MSGGPSQISTPAAFQAAFSVSRETLDRLESYASVLRHWQKTINLVAPSTLDHLWHRHFADSAQLLALAPPDAKTWVDVGSGAGFPGLVIAILLAERGKSRVTLVESDSRKAAFLGEVARQTGVAVEIAPARIEKTTTQAKVGRVDVVTARALAPLPRLFGLIAPLFSPETTALLLKGREVEAEIEAARQGWGFDASLAPSITDAEGRIAVIRNLHGLSEG